MDLVFIELLEKFKNYKRKYNELLNNYNNLIDRQNMNTNGNNINNYNNLIDRQNMNTNGNNINTLIVNTKCVEKIHPTLTQDIKLPDNIYDMSEIVKYIVDESSTIKMVNATSNFLEFERIYGTVESKDSEFRNKITDFINNEFFRSDNLLYNFIKNFIEIMELSLNLYIKEKTPKLRSKHSLPSTFTLEKNIIFILKGGNTLKSILEKYISVQAGIVGQYIHDTYGEYFKRSDLDFQIIIFPHLSDDDIINKRIYNEIVEDLKILSCYVLNRFRNTFLSNLSKTFNYYQYNNATKQKLLIKLLEDINSCDFFKKITSRTEQDSFIKKYGDEYEYYFNMKFTNINFNDVNSDDNVMNNFLSIMKNSAKILSNKDILNIINNQLSNELINSRTDLEINVLKDNIIIKQMIKLIYSKIDEEIQKNLYNDKNNRSELYISLIEDVKFERTNTTKGNYVTTFGLVRLKINFLLNLETIDNKNAVMNIPGELIDISISYFDDHKNTIFSNGKKINDLFTNYEFSNSNVEPFKFWSYNINSFIHDIFVILYVDVLLPWEDKKYKKRMYRMLFFATIQLLSKQNTYIDDLIADLTKFTQTDLDIIINNATFFVAFLNKNTGKNLGWLQIFEEHENIHKLINTNLTTKKDQDIKFKEYYSIIFENVKHLINIILKLNAFINLPYKGKVNVEDKEFNEIHQFAGDINHEKYLKYKNKYLQSKKY
jgi:hypothetical protein